MARCNSCFGVLTKKEIECYVCGEAVPGASRPGWLLRMFWAEPSPKAPVKSGSLDTREYVERFLMKNG